MASLPVAKHPAHPATVHFPIVFTSLTGALDTLYFASTHPSIAPLFATIFKTLSVQLDPATLPTLSYYSTILTILSSIPAVATGVPELLPLIKRDGFSSKKARTAVLHAVVNDVTIVAAVYNWFTRRSEAGFQPSIVNVLISAALALPATMFAAYLGGDLVYTYGMGVGRSQQKFRKSQ
ncbi:hypothetical protein CC78DRAFT_536328 [Lojkania enalia]|uniref:DUF2231 domain-containing protein n=1 Tax=Lojkania enalia TaxID=147567 RepID=A0A9P4K1T6_9PLEO|nr:hypothetical protein CC78DRAFT_536328 [Didymosphaeria enalia]